MCRRTANPCLNPSKQSSKPLSFRLLKNGIPKKNWCEAGSVPTIIYHTIHISISIHLRFSTAPHGFFFSGPRPPGGARGCCVAALHVVRCQSFKASTKIGRIARNRTRVLWPESYRSSKSPDVENPIWQNASKMSKNPMDFEAVLSPSFKKKHYWPLLLSALFSPLWKSPLLPVKITTLLTHGPFAISWEASVWGPTPNWPADLTPKPHHDRLFAVNINQGSSNSKNHWSWLNATYNVGPLDSYSVQLLYNFNNEGLWCFQL